MVIHDTECPYWDQVSLNNTSQPNQESNREWEKSSSVEDFKGHPDLPLEDYQQAVIDEILCMVAGYALGTDVCHWMATKSSNLFNEGQQN